MADRESDRWLSTIGGAILQAIGQYAVAFAHLEEEVAQLIWSLLAGRDVVAAGGDSAAAALAYQGQKVGQAVTVALSFRQKTQVLGGLAVERLEHAPAVLETVRVLRKELDAAEEERNPIIHSVWAGVHMDSGARVPGVGVRLKPKATPDGMRLAASLLSQEDLVLKAEAVARLAYRLAKVHRQVFAQAG